MLELDLTIDQYEALVAAAAALYGTDLDLPQEARSLEPNEMTHLSAALVTLGQIDEGLAWITTPSCIGCGEASVVELTDDEYDLLNEKRADGRPAHLIQNALAERDADFREHVKTGTHPECWAAMFPEEEEGRS